MKKTILIALFTAFLTGCMTVKTVELQSEFDSQAAMAQIEATGNNTIKGSALVKQRGGGIVTCAGRDVKLIPVNDYSEEINGHLFGNTQRGYLVLSMFSSVTDFNNTDKRFFQAIRTTMGDAQGYFEFDKVKAGEYFVQTRISWATGDISKEDCLLMLRVSVKDGETKKIVLSQ